MDTSINLSRLMPGARNSAKMCSTCQAGNPWPRFRAVLGAAANEETAVRTTISRVTLALLAATLVLAGTLAVRGQGPKRNALRDFMRQKLELSQKILEGVTVEDYG